MLGPPSGLRHPSAVAVSYPCWLKEDGHLSKGAPLSRRQSRRCLCRWAAGTALCSQSSSCEGLAVLLGIRLAAAAGWLSCRSKCQAYGTRPGNLPNSLTQSCGMCSLRSMLPPGVTWRTTSPGSPKCLALHRRICRGWCCMCSRLESDEAWGQRTPSPAWTHSMLRELHLPGSRA